MPIGQDWLGPFCEHHATRLSQHHELSLPGTLDGRPFPERHILSPWLHLYFKSLIIQIPETLNPQMSPDPFSDSLLGGMPLRAPTIYIREATSLLCLAHSLPVFLRHKAFIFFFWPCHVTYGILVSGPWIKPRPLEVKHGVLTTGMPVNFHFLFILETLVPSSVPSIYLSNCMLN